MFLLFLELLVRSVLMGERNELGGSSNERSKALSLRRKMANITVHKYCETGTQLLSLYSFVLWKEAQSLHQEIGTSKDKRSQLRSNHSSKLS